MTVLTAQWHRKEKLQRRLRIRCEEELGGAGRFLDGAAVQWHRKESRPLSCAARSFSAACASAAKKNSSFFLGGPLAWPQGGA